MTEQVRRYSRRDALKLFATLPAVPAAFILACGDNGTNSGSEGVAVPTVSLSPDNGIDESKIGVNNGEINNADVLIVSPYEAVQILQKNLADNKDGTPQIVLPTNSASLPIYTGNLETEGITADGRKLVERYLGLIIREGGVISAPVPGVAVIDDSQKRSWDKDVSVIALVTNLSNYNFTIVVGGEVEYLTPFEGRFQNLPSSRSLEVGQPILRIKTFESFTKRGVPTLRKEFPDQDYNVWLLENTRTRETHYADIGNRVFVGSDLTRDGSVIKTNNKFALIS